MIYFHSYQFILQNQSFMVIFIPENFCIAKNKKKYIYILHLKSNYAYKTCLLRLQTVF